ncbi:hypothetical protein FS837_010013 [Tulasnella sp. UAMH 9824]|nr:hypothetical protein FS837_010013 [Tulasnella sp. UAMH 9824]
MKLSLTLLPLVATCAWAGYNHHQADLEPESAVYTQPPPPAEEPKAQSFLERLQHAFDLENILTSAPVVAIAAKAGINITEKVQAAKAAVEGTGWDNHIPLITDENYREMIVEEPLSLDELDKRVWFLLIGIPNGDPVNKLVDERFEGAYNITQSSPEKALPHVRWGRINYLDVTAITTRWWVWKVPMLVVLRKGGRELRFYSPRQLRLQPDVLHKFLEVDGWKETPAWTGLFAPGGALEPTMEKISVWTMKSYIFITTVPRWIMLLATGALGSLLINVMHAGSGGKSASPKRQTSEVKHARIAEDAKEHDGGSAVRHTRADAIKASAKKDRSPSPKRQSARIQAQTRKSS